MVAITHQFEVSYYYSRGEEILSKEKNTKINTTYSFAEKIQHWMQQMKQHNLEVYKWIFYLFVVKRPTHSSDSHGATSFLLRFARCKLHSPGKHHTLCLSQIENNSLTSCQIIGRASAGSDIHFRDNTSKVVCECVCVWLKQQPIAVIDFNKILLKGFWAQNLNIVC